MIDTEVEAIGHVLEAIRNLSSVERLRVLQYGVWWSNDADRAKAAEAGQQPATQPARNAGTGGNPTEYQSVTTCGG